MTIAQQVGRVSTQIEMNQRAAEFGQLCRFLMLGARTGGPLSVLQTAEARTASDRVKQILHKSAVAPMSMTSTSQLADFKDLVEGFLLTMRNASAFDRILSDNAFRQIPPRTRTGAITVAPTATLVAEAGYKPLTSLGVEGGGLFELMKALSIVVITSELARTPLAVPLINAELRSALAAEVDVLMFQALQVTGVPNQASAGNTAANAWTDIAYLLANVTTGARSRLYFIAPSDTMKKLATRNNSGLQAFPGLGPQGGAILGTPAIVSDGLADGTLLLMDAQQIAAAADAVTLSTTEHATIALDTAPDEGSTLTSLWQQNMLGIRVERWFGVEALPTANALAFITGIS